MRKLLVLLTCVFVMQPVGSLYSASPAQELGKWWKNSMIVGQLELSDEQIVNIEQSYLHHRRALADLTRALKSEEDRLQSLMEADSLDDGKILDRAEQVAEARKDLEVAQTVMMLSFRKEMTVQQWKKLGAMREYRASFIGPVSAEADASKTDARKMFLPDGTEYYITGKGVQSPILVSQPKPPYSAEAKFVKTEGIVVLEAIVYKDGSVGIIKLLRSLGYGLDESAIKTIEEKWLFKPGMMNGQPVNIKVDIEVSFGLY